MLHCASMNVWLGPTLNNPAKSRGPGAKAHQRFPIRYYVLHQALDQLVGIIHHIRRWGYHVQEVVFIFRDRKSELREEFRI